MLNPPFLCFSVALIRQVLALLGPRITTEGIQLLVPTHHQISAAGSARKPFSVAFGSVNGGNWSVPTETLPT